MSESLSSRFLQLIDDPEAKADPHLTDLLMRRYPYFAAPAIEEIKRNSPDIDKLRRDKLLNHAALCCGAPEALYPLAESLGADLTGLYPPPVSRPEVSTEQAIDTFMTHYGSRDSREDELLERLIFNPTPDYAGILAETEEHSLPDEADAQGSSNDNLINAFILKSRKSAHGHFPSPDAPVEPPQPAPAKADPDRPAIRIPDAPDDTLLSESLAKIYIKQHRYSKAYEIISGLSLKYPEKSVYFADQLRFLQKLILTQNIKKQK